MVLSEHSSFEGDGNGSATGGVIEVSYGAVSDKQRVGAELPVDSLRSTAGTLAK